MGGRAGQNSSRAWTEIGFKTPPVMISAANRTETAARIKYAFDHKRIRIDELCVTDGILHIDSKALEMAELREEPVSFNGEENEDEEKDGPPPPPKTRIEPVQEKQKFEISWPNIIRIDHVYKPELKLEMERVEPLNLNANETATLAELSPTLEGKSVTAIVSEISLEELGKEYRMQKVIFETARDVYDQMRPGWKGNKEYLLSQVIRLVEKFMFSDKIQIAPLLFEQDPVRQRILLTLNMTKIVQHIWEAIRFENTESLVPVFDKDKPVRSTGDVLPWYTGKPCEYAQKSHINFCVYDSTWEAAEAFELDHNPNVDRWVKNDHIGFEIIYTFKGVIRKYRPDFIIRLKSKNFLILETKGQDTQQDKTKRRFLDQWVKAVNEHGGFGKWKWAVSKNTADVKGIIGNI